jgi:hypothetical protein
MVVQTFATHFSALLGAMRVPDFEGGKDHHNALALSAAAVSPFFFFLLIMLSNQVERAYTLWKDGALTIESLHDDKVMNLKNAGRKASKAIKKTVNTTTGKESAKDRAFNESNWGAATRNYLRSVRNLRENSFQDILASAQSFVRLGRQGDSQLSRGDMEVDEDERALLVDPSDDECECPLPSVIIYS